ncbi:MAG: FKBP-type peptidyl-prolyl cis-trans isomerase [Bacteroidales bacterium]|nr:FKBP-type peptidyl-prolyl cis-trans isomerase [Bacteroidales bacterium]MCF8327910.1 FKBP-type peptidyl-prolyl cis-trans isomerase [Bacteroidales bacterium]
MIKSKLNKGLGILVMVSLFFACNQGPHPEYSQTENGLYYKFIQENQEGAQLDSGDVITLKMKYYTPDSVYFNSSEDVRGDFQLSIQQPQNSMDIFAALNMMKVGDSATFIIPPDSFLGPAAKSPMDTIDELFVDIKIQTRTPLEQFLEEQAKNRKLNQKREKEKIDNYLSKEGLSADTLSNGIYVLKHSKTSGVPVESGKVALLSFTGELLNGEVFQPQSPEFPYVVGETPDYPFKWDAALKTMKKGEKATFLLPSDQALGAKGEENIIPPYSPLILEITVKDVLSKQEYQNQKLDNERSKRKEAKQKLNNYLKENNIQTKPTSSGLIYITQQEGKGPQPQKGDTALVHYKGYFLNGEVFDSSYKHDKPLEVVIGQQGLIQGWLEAIPKMKEGEKAKIILPWKLAYGKRGRGSIPPYADLVFELELTKIKS